MQAFVKHLCDTMLTRGIIDQDNYDICIYGLELLLSNALLFFVIGTLAAFTGTIWPSIWFTALFCVLRFHLGGFHCKGYGACFVFSVCIYACFLLCYLLRLWAYTPLWALALAAGAAGVFLLAHTLRIALRTQQKKRNVILCAVYLTAAVLFACLRQSSTVFTIVFAMITVSFLLILEKGETTHEQENI